MDVERTMEFLLQQAARTEAGLAKTEAGLARTSNLLRRAIRAGVKEARAERRKRLELQQDFEKGMADLRQAHAATEESLKAFIDSLRRGGNGHS